MELGRLLKVSSHLSCVRRYSIAGVQVPNLGKKAKRLLAEGFKEKSNVEIEKDTKKLVSEVCGTNLLEEGGQNVKIKPDSEYPDWLWKIHVGEPLKLEEMDPNSKQYWNKVNYLAKQQRISLLKLQKHKTLQK